MEELQVFTICTGAIVLTVCAMLAAIEALRCRNKQLRQELRQARAENARLRSQLQLSCTERDILNGRMEIDNEKHREAVALMAHEAGERYRTKDLLLRQRWQEVVG
mgnify:CR=1 FL=1